MGRIQLLITDLDGTLIGPQDEYAVYEQFRERLQSIKTENDARWAVITGRSLGSFKAVFRPLSFIGVTPDYLVARHAFIYGLEHGTFRPHYLWNARIRMRLSDDRRVCRQLLKKCLTAVRARFRRVQVISRQRDRLFIRFRDADTVGAAADLIRNIAAAHSGLHVFEYTNEVDIRSVPSTKGLAASELARHLNVLPANILAIGDGLNDISMLDGSIATMTACPSNSKIQVMEAVSRMNGHVSRNPVLTGAIDAINAHIAGEVDSEIPSEWRDAAEKRPSTAAPRPQKHQATMQLVKEITLFCLALTVIVLALAQAGLLGPLSSPLYKPFDWIMTHLARLLLVR